MAIRKATRQLSESESERVRIERGDNLRWQYAFIGAGGAHERP